MKHKMTVAVLLGLLSTSAFAEARLGLGLIAGEPTGLSVKYWLDKEHAVDGAAAWSFWDGKGFQVHGDFLWHQFDLLDDPSGFDASVPLSFGVGARLKFREGRHRGDEDDTVFGLRVPIGVSFLFEGQPFDIFAEIVPTLDFTPAVDLNFGAAIGMRFYLE
jgi:hypothetical protein